MNIFTKATLKNILDRKILSKEIHAYTLYDNKLHIKKSKRSKYTLDIEVLSEKLLIKLINKKIPDSNEINMSEYFIKEIRNVKLKELMM
jgi:hypothetical protein